MYTTSNHYSTITNYSHKAKITNNTHHQSVKGVYEGQRKPYREKQQLLKSMFIRHKDENCIYKKSLETLSISELALVSSL